VLQGASPDRSTICRLFRIPRAYLDHPDKGGPCFGRDWAVLRISIENYRRLSCRKWKAIACAGAQPETKVLPGQARAKSNKFRLSLPASVGSTEVAAALSNLRRSGGRMALRYEVSRHLPSKWVAGIVA
jgi:hypothetical protein